MGSEIQKVNTYVLSDNYISPSTTIRPPHN